MSNTAHDSLNSDWNFEWKDGHLLPIFNKNYRGPDDSSRRKLAKYIKRGTLEPEGEIDYESSTFKLTLKHHQRRSLHAMRKMETSNERISFNINAGILADKVGSGKSAVVLSLIEKYPTIDTPMGNFCNYPVYGGKHDRMIGFEINFESVKLIPTNLIVVPHSIFFQWENYIQTYTNLRYLAIRNSNDIEETTTENIMNYPIILVKSTMYNHWIRHVNYIFENFDYGHKFEQKRGENVYSYLEKLKQIHNKFGETISRYNPQCDEINDLTSSISSISTEMVSFVDEFKSKFDEISEKVGKFPIRDFMIMKSGIVFERVFFDEANSIRLPACEYVYGKMVWFITSSILDMIMPRGDNFVKGRDEDGRIIQETVDGISTTGFIRDIMTLNAEPSKLVFLTRMICKNPDTVIEESFNLPEPTKFFYNAFTPDDLRILTQSGALNTDTLQAINAGDIESAMLSLGCRSDTEEKLIDIVVSKLRQKHESLTHNIQEKNQKISELTQSKNENNSFYELLKSKSRQGILTSDESVRYNTMKKEREDINSQIQSNKHSIENFEKQIKEINDKIDGIESRLKDVENKTCPICTMTVNNPTITPCCKNVFCFECIVQSLAMSSIKNSCPLCRKTVESNKLTIIKKDSKSSESGEEGDLLEKIFILKKLIQNNPSGRFLIFSEFENTFETILNFLEKEKITYSKVNGSPTHIQRIIQKYTNGEIRVLLLNAKYFGAGLNLQMTSDIIIYHTMSSDLEKQVIGRGQRIGRSGSLKIHYLCYEHEYTNEEKITMCKTSEPIVNVEPEIIVNSIPEVSTTSVFETPVVLSTVNTETTLKKKRGRPRKIITKETTETEEDKNLMYALNEIYSATLDSFD